MSELSEPELSRLTEQIRIQSGFVDEVKAELGRAVIGQQRLVEALLIGLLCRGHVLIEGVPGLAKTLTVNTLARALGLSFKRIQFTPDLLPSDLLGTPVYHPGSGDFLVKKGPVFAHLVLADEINRAPAKVQSALLEAMEEGQVTLGEESFPLPSPFFVLATQNPLEHEGTYPLPEAQVDRFMLKVNVDYPSREEELQIIELAARGSAPQIGPVVAPEALEEAMTAVRSLYIAPSVQSYLLDLVEATRSPERFVLAELSPLIEHGVSPRGSICLALAARALAFLRHRPYVVPDDVIRAAPLVLRHRLILSYEAEAEGADADQILQRILDGVPLP